MPIKPLAADTTLEAEALQFSLFRRLSPWEKLGLVTKASQSIFSLHRAGIRLRSPGLSPEALQRRVAETRLGGALAARVYGPAPDR
jgi:hypothetical protein